jgi:hypothetical protein
VIFGKRSVQREKTTNPRRSKLLASLRTASLWTGALLILALGGGVAYTWYMGQQPSPPVAEVAPVAEVSEPVSAAKHMTPDPNAKASAAIEMLTSPVTPGMNASVSIKTNPNAECTISVVYDKTGSKDSGLVPKTADEFGMADWTWTVESTVPYGTWPVKITCTINKQSAVVQGDLVVAKQVN